jgi:hypothetical protein
MKHISTSCKIENMNNLKFWVAHFLLKLQAMNNKFQIATTSFKIKKIKGGWCIIPIAKQLFLLHHLILMKETINFNLSIKTYKTQKRCGATMLQPTTMTCNYKYLNKGPTIGEIFYINFFSYYVFFMFTIGGSINLDYLSSPLPMGVG